MAQWIRHFNLRLDLGTIGLGYVLKDVTLPRQKASPVLCWSLTIFSLWAISMVMAHKGRQQCRLPSFSLGPSRLEEKRREFVFIVLQRGNCNLFAGSHGDESPGM